MKNKESMKSIIAIVAILALFVSVVAAEMVNNQELGGAVRAGTVAPSAHNKIIGWDVTDALGNTATADAPNDKVYLGANGYGTHGCVAWVTNSAGTAITNTATVALEGSIDGSTWFNIMTESITALEVASIKNTTEAFARYLRANVTAIQNANNSYVNLDCISKE